jgi:hypothetical protein
LDPDIDQGLEGGKPLMEKKRSGKRFVRESIRWALAVWGVLVCLYLGVTAVKEKNRGRLYNPPTRTAVPSMTPYPTIPPTEAYQHMQDFMLAPPKCDLPCWWGFEPGKSTLTELHQSLSPFMPFYEGRDPNGTLESIEIWNSSRRAGEPIVDFILDGQTIKSIQVDSLGGAFAQGYDLTTFLKSYGRPDQVCLSLEDYHTGSPTMLLSLAYATKGVEVSYAYFPTEECCTVHVNLAEKAPVYLTLWEPGDTASVVSCKSKFWQPWRPFKPIDEVTDLSIDAFYGRFSRMIPGEDWLETSSQCWGTPSQ